jgi:hypothetical protein
LLSGQTLIVPVVQRSDAALKEQRSLEAPLGVETHEPQLPAAYRDGLFESQDRISLEGSTRIDPTCQNILQNEEPCLR